LIVTGTASLPTLRMKEVFLLNLEIILLRHGIAENRAKDGTDYNRKLTREGKDKLKERLPHLKNLITYKDQVEIWSSPLLRAKETAEILAESVHTDKIFYYDFIGEGDFDNFLMSVVREKEEKTIFVVGHEPYLGEWVYELTDQSIGFKKGAAAAFTVKLYDNRTPETEDMIEEASYSWYLTSKEMEKTEKKKDKE